VPLRLSEGLPPILQQLAVCLQPFSATALVSPPLPLGPGPEQGSRSLARSRPTLVILGGGYAGLRLLYHSAHICEVTLVDPRATSLARTMLHEVALGLKPVDHVQFDLAKAITRRRARLVTAAAERIDASTKTVTLSNGEVLRYDYLGVATGLSNDYDAVPGLEEHGYSLQDDLHAPRLAAAFEAFSGGPIVTGSAPCTWGSRVTVPPLDVACEGPIGEVAFMAHHDLVERGIDHSISLFSPGPVFFDNVGDKVRHALDELLSGAGITVLAGKTVSEVHSDHVRFSDGTELESALSIVAPPVRGPRVLVDSGLGDEVGYLPVDETMRALDDPHIFGAGDATALSLPKLGHIAVHQADLAAATLRTEITGSGETPPYKPEVFCIMDRGGAQATLVLSDVIFGGARDFARNSPVAHMLKWSFDTWSFHTRGYLPPSIVRDALTGLLREV